MNIAEKVALLRKMADDFGFEPVTGEGKLLAAMIDILEDVVEEVSLISAQNEQIIEKVDEMDEDLEIVGVAMANSMAAELLECGDQEVIISCPSCSCELIVTLDDMDEDDVVCPHCGEEIELDFEPEDLPSAEDPQPKRWEEE